MLKSNQWSRARWGQLRAFRRLNNLCQTCATPLDRKGALCSKCLLKHNTLNRSRNLRYKDAVYKAYGGYVCSCCSVTNPVFLTIDHINGGGGKHRLGLHQHFYKWLIDNKFPEGFRVLCMNCNWARRYGACPHEMEKNLCE